MKKLNLFLSSSILFGLFSCSSPNQELSKFSNDSEISGISIVGENLDKENGADISVSFVFGDNSFETKASADGVAPKKVSDIAKAKVYLITDNNDPMAAGSVKFTSGMLNFSSPSQTYTFSNVPTGGPYFVSVELFDSSDNNIIEPIAYGGTTGTVGLTVSSGTTPSITVDSDNKVSSTNAITVSPKLKNGTGATLDTLVTPSDGNSTNGAGITISG